jgi:lytic murein transglycosylase
VLAIWGLESHYGQFTGAYPVFQALATLAWEPRRSDFFRGELFKALSIVSGGYIDAKTMTGSWAGAMGQPQFMPSSYLDHAVDFDKDGLRDIWHSEPDTLASIASYLNDYGWEAGQLWGREVKISDAARTHISDIPLRDAGCSAKRLMTERRPLAIWREAGVRLKSGALLPQSDIAASLVEVGGRSFLVYPNYDTILDYNCAHLYALSVGMLADRPQSALDQFAGGWWLVVGSAFRRTFDHRSTSLPIARRRSPAAASGVKVASSSSTSAFVSSMLAAATFSSTYFTRLVPGIGTTSGPFASSHASASCAGVQRFRPAIVSRRWISARL